MMWRAKKYFHALGGLVMGIRSWFKEIREERAVKFNNMLLNSVFYPTQVSIPTEPIKNAKARKKEYEALYGPRKKQDKELIKAIYQQSLDKIRNCLNSGADINAKDLGYNTPLHHAVCFDIYVLDVETKNPKDISAEIIRFLIENGANLNAKNALGNTPLLVAQPNNWEILLKAGANITATNNAGRDIRLRLERSNLPEFRKTKLFSLLDQYSSTQKKNIPYQLSINKNHLFNNMQYSEKNTSSNEASSVFKLHKGMQ